MTCVSSLLQTQCSREDSPRISSTISLFMLSQVIPSLSLSLSQPCPWATPSCSMELGVAWGVGYPAVLFLSPGVPYLEVSRVSDPAGLPHSDR